MARLVLNHSTNIEGLIKWLKKLADEESIQTITPASLSKSRSRAIKLEIRISRPTREGFKLVARKGQLAQEIYIVTKDNYDNVNKMLIKSNPSRIRRKKDDY